MKLLENVGQIQIGAFKYPAYYCYFVISFVHFSCSESINKILKMWGNVGYFNISNRIKVSDHFWICTLINAK